MKRDRRMNGLPISLEVLTNQPLIHWFCQRVELHPGRTAFRYKHRGIWQEVTWAEYRAEVEQLALGLRALGLCAGDRVAILGASSPQWLYSDLAVQSLGAVAVGIYASLPAPDVAQLLNQAAPRFVIALGEEQADRLRARGVAGASVEWIILENPTGKGALGGDRLVDLAAVTERGRQQQVQDPGMWAELVRQRQSDEPIRICYTPGTTGRHKGVIFSSRNLIGAWAAFFGSMPEPPHGDDRVVTALPLAHVMEVAFSVLLPILYGAVAHIPEFAEALSEARVEVKPTLLFAPAPVWEALAAQVFVAIETGGWLGRALFRVGRARRARLLAHLWAGRKAPLMMRLTGWLSQIAFFRYILDRFGLGELRWAMVGGSPISAGLVESWQTWGLPLRECYGLTECSGIATVAMGTTPRPGSAGRPLPGMGVKLADDGEVLLSGPGVCAGESEHQEGSAPPGADWLATGDIGEFLPDGTLHVLDRRGNRLLTATGTASWAAQVESVIRSSPYVRNALLVGEEKPYLAAVLEIDPENVAEWARFHRIPYTLLSSLADHPQVRQLLQTAIDYANAILKGQGQPTVNAFAIMPHGLDLESGDDVTPIGLLKRQQLLAQLAPLVNGLYGRT